MHASTEQTRAEIARLHDQHAHTERRYFPGYRLGQASSANLAAQ
jgi:hypothetical protein